MIRFVVAYLRQQEAYRSRKPLDRVELERLLEKAVVAYEQERGLAGVVKGYQIGKASVELFLKGGLRPSWRDSLKLDAEQQAWMDRLLEEFRTSHTIQELDERLTRYEQEVVEALGEQRATVLLWSSGVLYGFAVMVFGREPWVEEFRSVMRTLLGMQAPEGGMARAPELSDPLSLLPTGLETMRAMGAVRGTSAKVHRR